MFDALIPMFVTDFVHLQISLASRREDLVFVDENTYGALQIFHRESHPSTFKAVSSHAAKEGLSLFGKCHICVEYRIHPCIRRTFLSPN